MIDHTPKGSRHPTPPSTPTAIATLSGLHDASRLDGAGIGGFTRIVISCALYPAGLVGWSGYGGDIPARGRAVLKKFNIYLQRAGV